MWLCACYLGVNIDQLKYDATLCNLPHARHEHLSWNDRRGYARLETRHTLGFSWDPGRDEMPHRETPKTHAMNDRAIVAALLGI